MGCAIYRASASTQGEHQSWDGYSDTPELTADWPYQIIVQYSGGSTYLILSTTVMYYMGLGKISVGTYHTYKLTGETWVLTNWGTGGETGGTPIQSNNDIYYNGTTDVWFSKTTIDGMSYTRIRNIRHKSNEFIRDKKMQYKDATFKRVNI